MKYFASLIAVLAAVWLSWSGIFEPLLLSLGAVSCVGVVLLSRRMGLIDAEGAPIEVTLRALLYAPWLYKEIVLANLDVARRVLTPGRAIAPRMIRVPTSQRTDLCRVIYANSITLTPGTVSVEMDEQSILVHALTAAAAEGLETGEMDRRVSRVEGRA